ncbi:MAG: TetR/AcrR family transcriptional regulator [Pirellulaceae bacterium]|nr:TetR/AcrR family transcriptional regulator [Pirellulaceae bacterium]
MGKSRPNLAGKPPPPPFMMADDKRSLVLRAAHKIFLRDGFSVTSMDAITLEAGVSKATVYAHFDSKDKLFETLIHLGSEAALKSTPSLERKGGDPRVELLTFFRPFLQLLFGSGGYAWSRMLIADAPRHPHNAQLFFDCTVERITQTVERYLQALAQDGLFPADNIRLSAEALVAMVLLGPLHRALLIGTEAIDFQQTLEFGIDLLLRNSPRA